jgi:hypothetical protein
VESSEAGWAWAGPGWCGLPNSGLESSLVLPGKGLCLLLPRTSTRQGIPVISPWKLNSWQCQIRYWAWLGWRGT